MGKIIRLNIGVGGSPHNGFVGVDKYPGANVDVLFNLDSLSEKGVKMPWATSSVKEIICEHTLEHVSNVVDVMNEFHRILKKHPAGKLTVTVPSARSWCAFASPSHKSYFTQETFRNYFAADMIKETQLIDLQMRSIKPWHIEKLDWTQTPGASNPFDIAQEIKCIMYPLK